jgi:EmrB/QacA subfamily drug resistance transporter
MADQNTRAPEVEAPVSHSEAWAFCAPEARKWVLVAAILASSLGFIDGSVMAIALPAMREGLGASLGQAQWFANAYLLVLSAFILAGGALGDRFGTVRVFSAGIAIFVLGSVLCAAAVSPETLIAARAVKGFGAALMVPGSMAMIGKAYPREDRGRALGLWSAASAITTALGPIIGGAVLTFGPDWAWRLIFAVNLPLGGLALWLLLTKVQPDKGQNGVPVDVVGAVLATLGLGLVAAAFTVTGAALAYGIAGLVILGAFLAWEWRAKAPMIRLGLFRNAGFSITNLATFFLYFALTAVMYFLPMTATTGWGVSEAEVTAAYLPFSVLIGVMSGWAGRMGDRVGAARMIVAGAAVVALAYAGLAVTAPLMAFWQATVPCMTLAAFGMGLLVAPLSAGVMASVGDDAQGQASGINNAVARVASLMAVSVAGVAAAWGYARAGGLTGFGEAGADQVKATTAGFVWVAGLAAACAALSAAIMALETKRR